MHSSVLRATQGTEKILTRSHDKFNWEYTQEDIFPEKLAEGSSGPAFVSTSSEVVS